MARVVQHPLPETPVVGFRPGDDATHRNRVDAGQGVQCWMNQINGFAVMQIHYTADPSKRSDDWVNKMSAPMGGRNSPDWRRNMELDWSVKKGLPVFGEFVNEIGHPSASHVILPKYEIPSWWTRRRGLDPGVVNPFAIAFWAKSPEGIHFLYDELYIRNAYNLVKNTPAGRFTGLTAVKYLIHSKSRGQEFESSYVDPQSKARTLNLGLGPESPRLNQLEELQRMPYPVDCVPARRTGAEYLDIEKMRAKIFARKHYRTLTTETLALLGIEHNESGYELFGGYFFAHCEAHRHEYKNLKWEEAMDPDTNPSEKIQDFDNHCWDADKYCLGEDWDPKPKRKSAHRFGDSKNWRAHQVDKDFNRSSAQYIKEKRGGRGESVYGGTYS